MKDSKVYRKKFPTNKDLRDESFHGSPDFQPFQSVNKGAEKLREKIENEFLIYLRSIHKEYAEYLHQSEGILVRVGVSNVELNDNAKEYYLKFDLTRQGDDLSKLTSLERALLEEGFTQKR